MTRFFRYVILALVALFLIMLAVVNSQIVEIRLLPVSISDFMGMDWVLRMPLFLVVFGGVLIGLLLGFVWEWFRAHKTRASANVTAKKAKALEKEVQRLKHDEQPQDEVLALLDKAAR